jgi:NDP-sugar pyrophosphorylase family protein
MLAVVLAAGRGTRLRPLTDVRSKAMLPIAGEPMVGRVLDMLGSGGVGSFVLVAHPEDGELLEYVERCAWAGRIRIAYQTERKGMADAVARAGPLVRESGEAHFLLAACDNLYPEGHVAALSAHHCGRDLDATLTLMRVRPEVIPTLAVVELKRGRVTRIVEKPRPEDAPSDLGVPALYALATRVLDYLPRVPVSQRGELEFPDVLRLLVEDGGGVEGVLVADRMTLTRAADLLALNRAYLSRSPACADVSSETSAEIIPPVRIDEGAVIGNGCRIGPEVYLETGCVIGPAATIRRAVVLRGAVVGPGATVEDAVLG